MLEDRQPDARLLLGLDALETSPLLKASAIKVWQRLKEKFDWIDTTAGYAFGAFVHHLVRAGTAHTSAQIHFVKLKKQETLQVVFLEPSKIDAEVAESLVRDLPSMDGEGSTQHDE